MKNACTLCPRRCAALRTPEGGNGFCRLPQDMLIARIQPHYWEEPPISGQYGTGAVFFSGCTLRCAYCQNGDISHRNAGRTFTPAQLAHSLRLLVEEGVHSISLITATPYVEKILETLSLYHPPVPIIWNTSGYETKETLQLLNGVIDIFLPDLKHFSTAMGQLCAGAPDYFQVASAAIVEMCRQTGLPQYDEKGIMQKGTLVRHLILPGLTGESLSLLDWLHDTLPPGTPLSLMRQYVPCNDVSIPGLTRRLTDREYQRVLDRMMMLEIPGFVQEKESASGDFIPVFGQDESYIEG